MQHPGPQQGRGDTGATGMLRVQGTDPLALSERSVLLGVFLENQMPLTLLHTGIKTRKASINWESDPKVLEN